MHHLSPYPPVEPMTHTALEVNEVFTTPNMEKHMQNYEALTPDQVINLQKNDICCKNILPHIHCRKNDNYFIDAIGILHKKLSI